MQSKKASEKYWVKLQIKKAKKSKLKWQNFKKYKVKKKNKEKIHIKTESVEWKVINKFLKIKNKSIAKVKYKISKARMLTCCLPPR